MFEYDRLSINDEVILNASIKHFNKYEMFFLSVVLDLGRDDLFGDKKTPKESSYSIDNIRFFLLNNDFIKMLGKDVTSPIELTKKGRLLRQQGSIESYIKFEELQNIKDVKREELGDIILDHHANIIGWERKYNKWLQIGTILLSVIAIWVSWKSYERENTNSKQHEQIQERLNKLEIQSDELENVIDSLKAKHTKLDTIKL